MRSAYRHGSALLLLLGLPVVALAQQAPPCTAMVAPSDALAAWSAPIERAAAGDAQHLVSAEIPVGQALHLALLPQGAVVFPLQPGKPDEAGSHAGLLRLTIAEAGTYRIALASAAWIDVVDNGQAVTSSAHMHGPACTAVHKMVDFPLHKGAYSLQISGNAEPQTTVLVVRVR